MRLPRPRPPFSRRRARRSSAPWPRSAGPGAYEAVRRSAEVRETPPTSQAPARAAPQGATRQPLPNAHHRIDGLRAWLAQLDRRLGVRTYILGAVAVVALAAAAAALVLTLQLRDDAATSDDIQSLRDELSSVQRSAAEAAQESVRSASRRLTDLEHEVARISGEQTTLKRELRVVRGDVKEPRGGLPGARGGSQAGGLPTP